MDKVLEGVTYEVPNVVEAIPFYRWFLGEEPSGDFTYSANFVESGFRLVQGHNPNRDNYVLRLSDDIAADYYRSLELGALSRSPSSPGPVHGLTDYQFSDPWGNIIVLRGAGRLSS